MDGPDDKEVQTLLAAALEGTLSEAQADRLEAIDAELLKLALLATSKRIAEQNLRIDELQARLQGAKQPDPNTPSGQRPIYAKPPAPKRKRKPGARKGHKGAHRPAPQQIDEHVEHRAQRCPHCGGELQRCKRTRTRTIEDVLEDLRTIVTEHTIHRDYCPTCKKHVEPVVSDALPKAKIGHRLIVLTAWLHYGVGVTIGQLREVLSYHLQTRLSAGGLVAGWQRLARLLESWYEQIADQAPQSAALHADETGWRVNGQTCRRCRSTTTWPSE